MNIDGCRCLLGYRILMFRLKRLFVGTFSFDFDSVNDHDFCVVIDRIEDTIVPYSNAVAVFGCQLFTSARSWLSGQ